MTRQTKTRRSAPRADITPRDFLLAGLGAVSLGRKKALQSYADLSTGAHGLRQRANAAAHDAGVAVAKLRKQAEAKVKPARKQLSEIANKTRSEVKTRLAPVLAPVLARFGAKTKAKRVVRKPAAKRPAARSRKAA